MAEGGIEHSVSDTEGVPRNSSLHSDHSGNYVEKTSVEVCYIMTHLGYGEEIRRRRILKHREKDSIRNARRVTNRPYMITAGSKAEGLSFFYESDHDFLFILNVVLCVEVGVDLHTIPDDIEVYRMNTRVYPGHCRMLLERQGSTRLDVIQKALYDDGKGHTMLSSGLFVDEFAKTKSLGVLRELAGPPVPRTINGRINMDYVSAIPCQCPSIMQRWAERPRNWPTPDVVRKVVSLGSFVTPVGFKESEYKFLEWRICFNTGETELVNNLSTTQAKLYVLLKMIVKDRLNPKKKEVTSYVLKNIILWQAESNSPTLFQENKLFHWLHDAMRTLKTAIAFTQLPYYMIPDRNLMAACGLQDEQGVNG
ncbi:uncharacterized protein LOC127850725 [Dreissena polymorpha]|uniref:Mab-21-like HhH/H2TH-like domain-containing protein n=1 Tax=Dreissena polymorpha TaxID=45954 RepID=A0A9D4HVJ1_DREPO|nr:uncharacterized protein LOC127850725 [Dreissena polymorpha]KAH3734243.1 hypothetical protein DPMN_040682 [Dreissena polymorpha]